MKRNEAMHHLKVKLLKAQAEKLTVLNDLLLAQAKISELEVIISALCERSDDLVRRSANLNKKR